MKKILLTFLSFETFHSDFQFVVTTSQTIIKKIINVRKQLRNLFLHMFKNEIF